MNFIKKLKSFNISIEQKKDIKYIISKVTNDIINVVNKFIDKYNKDYQNTIKPAINRVSDLITKCNIYYLYYYRTVNMKDIISYYDIKRLIFDSIKETHNIISSITDICKKYSANVILYDYKGELYDYDNTCKSNTIIGCIYSGYDYITTNRNTDGVFDDVIKTFTFKIASSRDSSDVLAQKDIIFIDWASNSIMIGTLIEYNNYTAIYKFSTNSSQYIDQNNNIIDFYIKIHT